MEDLASNISNMTVSKKENSIYADHPRFKLYKAKSSPSSQEKRRQKILSVRNKARYDVISHLRSVEEDYHQNPKKEEYDYDVADSDDEYYVEKFYAQPKGFKNFLMLNEWLVEVPENFKNTYYAVPCPVGKRCLVVCSKGKSKSYGKNGRFIESFQSTLPGGSCLTAKKGCTMLDTIYCYDDSTYYVVDLIIWMRQPFMECETSFRFHWLHSQFTEWEGNSGVVSKYNRYRFITLPYVDCTSESLTKLMSDAFPFEAELDGVMFFHKESQYLHGPSPLVGWLKSYMFTEVLGVKVPKKFMKTKPTSYVSLTKYLTEKKKKQLIYKEENARTKSKNEEMEEKEKQTISEDKENNMAMEE